MIHRLVAARREGRSVAVAVVVVGGALGDLELDLESGLVVLELDPWLVLLLVVVVVVVVVVTMVMMAWYKNGRMARRGSSVKIAL